MSYEPLHHKYRPQTFADLIGQEAIATTLTNAIRKSQIAPAYLFTGSRGTGKTSSARILSKSLNCLSSPAPTEKPCGKCDACQGITKGIALDVIEIDAASNTGVDNIREIIERAQFAPVQCRYKVYAIDECHMLSSAAFNCLLKTLEEPPKSVVFILATTDPERVLPTIISRCQRFDFRRIPIQAIADHLRYIATEEGISINAEALQLVAQLAQGGLRDAESLLDQLSLLSGEITIERVWDLAGSVSEKDCLELLNAIAQNHPDTILESARKIMDRGREPVIVLQNLAGFYRDLLIAKTAPTRSDLVSLTPATWAKLGELALKLEIATIINGQQHLAKSEVQIKNSTQPRLWLEVTLLGLLSANTPQKPVVAIPQQIISAPIPETKPTPVIEQITRVEPTPTPIVPPDITSQPLEAEPTVVAGDSDLWQQVVKEIQPYSAQALVSQQCRLLSFDGSLARVGIASQPLLAMVQNKIPNIEAAFQKLGSQKVKVTVEVGKEAKTTPPPKAPISPPPPLAPELPVVTPQPTPVVATPSTDTTFEIADNQLELASQRLAEAFKGETVNFNLKPLVSSNSPPVTQAETLGGERSVPKGFQEISTSASDWDEEDDEEIDF
ncbi:DNA polymerase III subunit gamma/tau [Chlorogloea sp. CCALA 695]|uniref:DNA polymerase III subunit gamma/tau n=1 Tax=Chlorogloea sp. CCALA 695 TaxID=2107693 RepID=UPI000D062049|nr:DNA polymerase III subunit gamma/tau [Chlorogloea sp. CCALA 695]PSB35460.1 DNA polymerase III subunit gamma/tau [Chlorogloea sp. CCALA 695]